MIDRVRALMWLLFVYAGCSAQPRTAVPSEGPTLTPTLVPTTIGPAEPSSVGTSSLNTFSGSILFTRFYAAGDVPALPPTQAPEPGSTQMVGLIAQSHLCKR